MAFGTDAIIAKYSWHVYLDDKAFWPPYDLVPYVRKDVLDKYPEIEGILNKLEPDEAAREYLVKHGLVK